MRNQFSLKWNAVYLLFFLSGMSALIYEIAWLNRIQLIMGYTIYALSTVLGAYLSGLALGALMAHRFTRNAKQCLALYLLFELGIGFYGLLFTTILSVVSKMYSPLVTDQNIPLPLLSLIQFFFCGLVIFIPTFLMGATLPLLAKHLFETREHAAQKIGTLYGINTFGAMAGCIAAGYFLLPHLGYNRTMYIAGGINVFLFMVALLRFPLGKFEWKELFPKPERPMPPLFLHARRGILNPLVWLMFMSGALSVLAQLLWNRLAALTFGPSVFIFSLITTTVLFGIFLGSFLSSRFADTKERSLRFLGMIILVGIPAVSVGNHLFSRLPMAVLWLNSMGNPGHGLYVLFQFALMAVVALPAAVCIGAIFPATLSLYTREEEQDLSIGVGVSYGMNIAGVLFGAIIGGFVFIPIFGIDTLSRSMAAILILCLLIVLEKNRPQWLNYAAAGLLAFITYNALPPFDKSILTSGYFYNRIRSSDVKDFDSFYDSLQSYHDTYRYGLIDYKDDAHGTVSIHEYVNNPAERWFRIDGKTDGNRQGDAATVRLLDYFPQLFRENFENILTIGLGTGESASLTAEIRGMKSSKVLELSPSMIHFAQKYFPENSKYVWSDPRIQVINRDGREFLLHTNEKYDLILSEPSNPWVNGVASLFTREFFTSISGHLKPGGIASVWFHSYGLSCDAFDSVVMAAYHSFRHLMIFKRSGDFYFIGTNDLPLDLKPLPPERAYLEPLILELLDSNVPSGANLRELYAKKLSESIWVRNRSVLDQYAKHSRWNSDDNQFLQYSGGRTYRRKISCYLPY